MYWCLKTLDDVTCILIPTNRCDWYKLTMMSGVNLRLVLLISAAVIVTGGRNSKAGERILRISEKDNFSIGESKCSKSTLIVCHVYWRFDYETDWTLSTSATSVLVTKLKLMSEFTVLWE